MQYAASLPEQQVPHSVSSAEMLKATDDDESTGRKVEGKEAGFFHPK